MNTNTPERPAQGALAALAATLPAGQGLVTLDPAKYVAEVFRSFRGELDLIKAEAATVVYDITTTAGMKVATEWRAKARALRLSTEQARKDRKAPIIEIGKLLDSQAKLIEAEIEPIETRFNSDIKAEEARKEQVKAAEAARKEAIRLRVVAIREIPLSAVGKSAAEISAMIALLVDDMPDESFGDLLDAAKAARTESLDKLAKAEAAQRSVEVEAEAARQQAIRDQLAREEESARIAAERAELAQLREAAAERARIAQAEADRIAAAQKAEADRLAALAAEQEAAALRERERAAALLKAEADAQAEKNRKAQEEIDRQRKELLDMQAAERQRAADAAQRMLNEQAAAALAEQSRLAAVAAEQQRAAERAAANIAADAAPSSPARLQALADQNLADKREMAQAERITGVPMRTMPYAVAGAPLAALADSVSDAEYPSDSDIIDMMFEQFGLLPAEAIERLAAFDAAAARAALVAEAA